jgi:hypothetical protein
MPKYRRVLPVPVDLATYVGLDLSPQQVMFVTDDSYQETIRKCRTGFYESFKPSPGKRRITVESVMRRRAEAIARGPQFSLPPTTMKRRRGRPRKARPDDSGARVPAE